MNVKFIVTKAMALDGSMIYPGTYDLKWYEDDLYIVGNGNFNWIATRKELLKCGYVENYEPFPFCYV